VGRAAGNGAVATVAELVDVVLYAPALACVIGAGRHDLGGDDAVGEAVAVHQHGSVDIADHGFALREVPVPIGSRQAHRSGVGEIVEGVRLVRDPPRVLDGIG